jgi:hypothetical protein
MYVCEMERGWCVEWGVGNDSRRTTGSMARSMHGMDCKMHRYSLRANTYWPGGMYEEKKRRAAMLQFAIIMSYT